MRVTSPSPGEVRALEMVEGIAVEVGRYEDDEAAAVWAGRIEGRHYAAGDGHGLVSKLRGHVRRAYPTKELLLLPALERCREAVEAQL